ncbi:MAG TPA: holo-[acyl-carrier-protein] synthase [Anaerolineae bacterium]|nr:holo-[acyl-carrier-protein] synthase [Anaerolineae bacterium]
MKISTGIDLIDIERFENLKPAILKRFLQRVFTQRELAQIQGSLTSAAGRFAAKEAVAKALGCGIGPISWKEVEILRGPRGEPLLSLNKNALLISQEQGLVDWSISISHTKNQAIALAVAYSNKHNRK